MRVKQSEYNRLLNAFKGREKSFTESVNYLIGLGFSPNQAKNAVHVYYKSGPVTAKFRLSRERRNELLDAFNGVLKSHNECVDFLRSLGCTYRQANSAVYKYRQERGLIGT